MTFNYDNFSRNQYKWSVSVSVHISQWNMIISGITLIYILFLKKITATTSEALQSLPHDWTQQGLGSNQTIEDPKFSVHPPNILPTLKKLLKQYTWFLKSSIQNCKIFGTSMKITLPNKLLFNALLLQFTCDVNITTIQNNYSLKRETYTR